MRIARNEVDSEVLGGAVLELSCPEPQDDIAAIERTYLIEHHPRYAVCKVPSGDIAAVHALEDVGFRFVEFQFRLTARLRSEYDVNGQPYRFEPVESHADLEPVLDLAACAFTEDRYSCDPAVGQERSGLRYRRYVAHSFERRDERVYRLVSIGTGEVVAFKTHRFLDPSTALLLLGAVKPCYRGSGIAVMNEYCELNELRRNGIRRIQTHVSGRNLPIVNLEVARLGFRVEAAFVVLRKEYAP